MKTTMTTKERIVAALTGKPADHTPLTAWCFGFQAPDWLRWQRAGRDVSFWFSKRLEHLHTLPHAWDLQDEFNRCLAWRSVGMDNMVEISVPWSRVPGVTAKDSVLAPGAAGGDPRYPVMIREYTTPSGPLRHAVRKTENEGNGWPLQPDCVPVIEDYNIPRAVKHIVTTAADVEAIRHVFAPPDDGQRRWFREQMAAIRTFAEKEGFFVQAWTAFGMDAAVWFTGTENAILMAIDEPAAFGRLMDTIAATDYARTEVAATMPGVDMVCQRGWYSSTDFWSPALFDQFVFPHLKELTALAHRHGKKFGYVMTTGVRTLGPRLADAGVDLLYFVDPVMDGVPLETARDLLGDRMTLVGGTNALSLGSGDPERIRREGRTALDVLGPTNRFILHPVDAIFPDTPWTGVQTMIDAWKEYQ